MSRPRSLLDLPAETRLRIYDFTEPGHIEWNEPHPHLTLMGKPKPNFLALFAYLQMRLR